ncbi:MAG: glycosyltransferase [Myxococcales bacterium]|nr:glycosyltransferase [Myxococcales bacterium]
MTDGAAPRLSVLLPCRDAHETIEEAIDSVLAQRGVALEVITVDDGSSDGSTALLRALAARHRALRVLRTDGVGIASALALAAREARADLLARMDADDVSLPERFARQVEHLDGAPRLGALGTRVSAFPEGDVQGGLRRYVRWQNGLLDAAAHRAQLFVESPLCHPSVVLRRAAYEAVGGYRSGPFPEDYDLWLRLDAAGYGLAKLDATLLRWRHHATRATLTDPRYARARFTELKAAHLARRVRGLGRPLDLWGAGQTGKRLARELERHGARVQRFIDIDPRKIGRSARGAPIVAPDALGAAGERTLVVAVGARGARDLVRGELDERGHVEGRDYLCAA